MPNPKTELPSGKNEAERVIYLRLEKVI